VEYADIAVIAAAAFVATALLTPLSIILARRFGVLAQPTPGAEAIHSEPAPRLGGLAIVGGVVLAAAAAMCLHPIWRPATHGLLLVIGMGGVGMCLVGLLDDLEQFPWGLKLACEIGIAGSMAAVGVHLGGVHPAITIALSIFWIVGVTNAVNLLDGMDGLAAGVSAIAGLAFVVIAAGAGGWHIALLAAAIAGSCLGFLLFNFYPSKTFMGDSGSLFLGFILATALLPLASSPERYSLLCAAIVALGLPIHDTLISMFRRFRRGQSMFSGDLGHFYNQLIDRFGLSQRATALISCGVAAALGLLAIGIARLSLEMALLCTLAVTVLVWGVAAKLGFTDHVAAALGEESV